MKSPWPICRLVLVGVVACAVLYGSRLSLLAEPLERPLEESSVAVSAEQRGSQTPGKCLQSASEAMVHASQDGWEIRAEFNILDVDQIKDEDEYEAIWHDSRTPSLSLEVLDAERLPSLHVLFLFDIDRETVYAGGYLDDGDDRLKEKEFWQGLCRGLVESLELNGTRVTDKATIYIRAPEDAPHAIKPVCTKPECIEHRQDVYDRMIEAIEHSYALPRAHTLDHDSLIKAFERQQAGVLVVVRWRSDPLPGYSYPLDDSLFMNRSFVLLLSRSADLPPNFEELQKELEKDYGSVLAYVPALPGRDFSELIGHSLDDALHKMRGHVEGKRDRLALQLAFPFLLDDDTFKNGRLEVYQRDCRSKKMSLDFVAPEPPDEHTRGTPSFVWVVYLAALLAAVQVYVFLGCLAWFIRRLRGLIDTLANGRNTIRQQTEWM